jgi:hypothetical protein
LTRSRRARAARTHRAAWQHAEAICIWRSGGDRHRLTRVIEDVDVETLPAEIQSDVQHMGRGLLYGLDAETSHSLPTGRPSSSHSHSVRSGQLPDTMRTEVRTAPRSDGRPTARGLHLGAGGDPAENLTCGALQINRVTALLTLLDDCDWCSRASRRRDARRPARVVDWGRRDWRHRLGHAVRRWLRPGLDQRHRLGLFAPTDLRPERESTGRGSISLRVASIDEIL